MKKLIFVFCLLGIFVSVVHAQDLDSNYEEPITSDFTGAIERRREGATSPKEKRIFDLGEALLNLGIDSAKQPEHLPGSQIAGKGASIFEQIHKSPIMGGGGFIITYYIQKIANALTGLAAALAVLFIIQNSFNLLTSSGDSEMITKSKKGLMWSLIGLVLIMGSYIVVKTVISLPYAAEGRVSPTINSTNNPNNHNTNSGSKGAY